MDDKTMAGEKSQKPSPPPHTRSHTHTHTHDKPTATCVRVSGWVRVLVAMLCLIVAWVAEFDLRDGGGNNQPNGLHLEEPFDASLIS